MTIEQRLALITMVNAMVDRKVAQYHNSCSNDTLSKEVLAQAAFHKAMESQEGGITAKMESIEDRLRSCEGVLCLNGYHN